MLNKDYTMEPLYLEGPIVTNVENHADEGHISLELPRPDSHRSVPRI